MGKHVFFEDAVEDMFPDIYKDAVLTQDIRPVGRPSVSKMDIADDGSRHADDRDGSVSRC